MLNCEFADHPEYGALELQWFDDDRHGRGMLAFLSRRSDKRVGYYMQPGLRLERADYGLGAGIGVWVETDFEVARLIVADDGVFAEARFTDIDGRAIQVRIDDRDGHHRERAGLLAPVSAGHARRSVRLDMLLRVIGLVAAHNAVEFIAERAACHARIEGHSVHMDGDTESSGV